MIELINASKIYRANEQQYTVLHNINLRIYSGEFVSIVGSSGSGKTTIMQIMGLLDQLSAGRYLLNGKDVSNLDHDQAAEVRNQKIGFIFQQFYLLPSLTALQNVCVPLLYRGVNFEEMRAFATQILDRLGLRKYADLKPSQLSGGQQQRVAIARAIISRPTIILADEPTGALDSDNSKNIIHLLKEIHAQLNTTVVVVTHDMQIANQCQRIVKILNGKIVE